MTRPFRPASEVDELLGRALAASPADETELVWLERRYANVWPRPRNGGKPQAPRDREGIEEPRLTVLVRVVEAGRSGWFRTDCADPHEIEAAIRQALAMAKVAPRAKRTPVLPTNGAAAACGGPDVFDEEISQLDADGARERLSSWLGGSDAWARLHWSDARVAVYNSHGLRRATPVSEVTLEAISGRGPGAGRAASSSRTLARLDGNAVVSAAQARRGDGEPGTLEAKPVPTLLRPEATTELLDLLNCFAFAGRTYLDGTSFLSQHRGVQVFDRAFHLEDDATRADGLPFPFDLEGSPKSRLELIVAGQPSTVALNLHQGVEAGLRPTAGSVGGEDSLFGNLFLSPGEAGEEELLQAAEGGIAVSWLEHPGCFDPVHLRIRATARGVRRVRDGRLAEPLPDFAWEGSLLQALARLRAVGRETTLRATRSTLFGGISAPAVVVESLEGLRPLD